MDPAKNTLARLKDVLLKRRNSAAQEEEGRNTIRERLVKKKAKTETEAETTETEAETTNEDHGLEQPLQPALQPGQQDRLALEKLKYEIESRNVNLFCVIEAISGPSFVLSITSSNDKQINRFVGPYHPIKLIISPDGQYEIRVNVVDVAETGRVDIANEDRTRLCNLLSKVSSDSPYVICQGLSQEEYLDLNSKLGYQPKYLFTQKWPMPVNRHVKCRLFYKPKRKSSNKKLVASCSRCCILASRLNAILRRRKKRPHASIRRSTKSTHRIDFLSPPSKKARLKNIQSERKYFRKIARRYWESTKVRLNEKENDELSLIVDEIEKNGKEELENIFSEAEKSKPGRGKTLKEVWKMDRLAFLKDQRKNATGRKDNRWSTATFRMAIAVYSRSPCAYSALKNLGILQLPCERQVEKLIRADSTGPGYNEDSIAANFTKYEAFKKQQEEKGMPIPLGFGALIFDETKVQTKILFDMNGGTVKGFAMTPNELPFLDDLFETMEQSKSSAKASYILQFIWRDLTSSYSVIGPYFTCEKSWDHSFLYDCVMRTVKLFTFYKFMVRVMVCDGASSNLALLKVLSGYNASKLPDEEPGDGIAKYLPKMVFNNPYCSDADDSEVFMVICPSHQLKNQIAALYSSRPNGTKTFEIDNVPIGWKAITDQYTRDRARVEQNLAPKVPGLRYSFVYRDVWTRLNVLPAKIMQQRYMISALRSFSEIDPPTPDAASVALTADYLDACNLLFERGILSRQMVRGTHSPVLENIKDGFQFFVNWHEKHQQKVYRDNRAKSRQKYFLAWQTWDLLRIMTSSFLGYSKWFFSHVPDGAGYYIAPIRINGSAIESLFSMLKYGAGGNLSALNYTSGLARIQARREVSRVTDSGKGYRDDSVLHDEGAPSMPIASKVLIFGRNKPYDLGVTEFLFPLSICQSNIGGRNGSNACTLIAILMGSSFLKKNLQPFTGISLPGEWSSLIVNCINDGNTLHDIVFEGQAVNLDVEDAFQNFSDELELASYDENICNCTNSDMTSVIGVISQVAVGRQRKAAVLITGNVTVSVLCFGGGNVAILDSHKHGEGGSLICFSSSTREVLYWYQKSYLKYNNSNIENTVSLTWLTFSYE